MIENARDADKMYRERWGDVVEKAVTRILAEIEKDIKSGDGL